MTLPFPPVFIAYGVAALVAVGGLWGLHHHVEGKGYDRGKAECAAEAAAQREKEQKAGSAASTGLEKDNAKARVIYKTIERKVDRIVTRDVYRNICFDDDGLRAAREALAGPRALAGKLDRTLPGSDAAGRRDGGDGATEAR